MNHTDKPTPPGDLDARLAAFFKSEMPKTWPAFQPPASRKVVPFRPAAPESSPFVITSKFALAMSIALLLLGGWLLSGVLSVPFSGDGKFPGTPTNPLASDKGKGHRMEHLAPELPGRDGKQPGKVKSSLNLEQGEDGRTGVRITVEPLPSNK